MRSVHASCFEGPFQIFSGYASLPDLYAQGTHQILMGMLSARISSWPVCSGYASVLDAYAQHVLKGLRSLKIRLSWCVQTVVAPNDPLNIFYKFFILTPKSPSRRNLMLLKSWKSDRWKISHLGTFNGLASLKLISAWLARSAYVILYPSNGSTDQFGGIISFGTTWS